MKLSDLIFKLEKELIKNGDVKLDKFEGMEIDSFSYVNPRVDFALRVNVRREFIERQAH